jgi:hypothetical protein
LGIFFFYLYSRLRIQAYQEFVYMPNRFQEGQHRLVYNFIVKIDGEYCLACFIEKRVKRGPPTIKLQIDHADGNSSNWSPDNLHFLCQMHNLKMRNLTSIEHKKLIDQYSAKNESMREREIFNAPTTIAKELVDYTSGSSEMQANSIFETKWLDFMHGWIRTNGSIPKEEAINSGALIAGCNPITTARYLSKYTSSLSCFKISRDSSGVKNITYRKENNKERKP